MSEPKFFNKVKVTDSKDLKITSTSIFKNHLIIGDANGGIHSYEITSKNKFDIIQRILFHANKCKVISPTDFQQEIISCLEKMKEGYFGKQ